METYVLLVRLTSFNSVISMQYSTACLEAVVAAFLNRKTKPGG